MPSGAWLLGGQTLGGVLKARLTFPPSSLRVPSFLPRGIWTSWRMVKMNGSGRRTDGDAATAAAAPRILSAKQHSTSQDGGGGGGSGGGGSRGGGSRAFTQPLPDVTVVAARTVAPRGYDRRPSRTASGESSLGIRAAKGVSGGDGGEGGCGTCAGGGRRKRRRERVRPSVCLSA